MNFRSKLQNKQQKNRVKTKKYTCLLSKKRFNDFQNFQLRFEGIKRPSTDKFSFCMAAILEMFWGARSFLSKMFSRFPCDWLKSQDLTNQRALLQLTQRDTGYP
jgi:hypothetical protein